MPKRKDSRKQIKYDAVIATPIGQIGIFFQNKSLVDIRFLPPSVSTLTPRTAQARKACHQLRSYFHNPRKYFHIPLAPVGTPFQRRVWRALRRIPAGLTLSYGALAQKLSTSPRAVGNACRANPVPIIIPCHRVVAANGDGGFMGKRSGSALHLKQWLLQHERV